MGREMLEIVPVAFLPEDHALAIAAMSYNGKLDFGLLGDYDAMPDLERFAGFLEESLAELEGGGRKAASSRGRLTTTRTSARRGAASRLPAPSRARV